MRMSGARNFVCRVGTISVRGQIRSSLSSSKSLLKSGRVDKKAVRAARRQRACSRAGARDGSSTSENCCSPEVQAKQEGRGRDVDSLLELLATRLHRVVRFGLRRHFGTNGSHTHPTQGLPLSLVAWNRIQHSLLALALALLQNGRSAPQVNLRLLAPGSRFVV